jgi:hypothetical protein
MASDIISVYYIKHRRIRINMHGMGGVNSHLKNNNNNKNTTGR